MNSGFLDEIISQPEALSLAIANYPTTSSTIKRFCKNLKSGNIRHVILTGMGASLYSCYPLWLTLNNHGIIASMWDTSELINYSPNIIRDDTLLVVISQSGESAEIKRLTSLRKSTKNVIGITNNTKSNLANWANLVIYLKAGEENSVSSKTFSTSLAVLHLLGSQFVGEDLPKVVDQLYEVEVLMRICLDEKHKMMERMTNFFGAIESLALLGRGYSMASVMYGALALKEASKVFTFGMSSAQFRHGPIELLRPGFNAIMFSGSKRTQKLNEILSQDIYKRKGRVLMITSDPTDKELDCFQEIPIPKVRCEYLPFLEIIPIQFFAISNAEIRGYQAGVFEVGNKVTEFE